MLKSNGVMFGWNRPVPGREGMAGELFGHVVNYLDKVKASGKLETFEPVFLAAHGGDMNGYILIKGSNEQLVELKSSDEWLDIVLRAGQYLQGFGLIDAYTGNTVSELMNRWTKTIPAR